MRVLASSAQLTELTVNDGAVRKRNKDGTFHVPDSMGKGMVKGSEFAQVGVNLRSAQGYVCADCGFVAVFKDRCGRCGGSTLQPEEE